MQPEDRDRGQRTYFVQTTTMPASAAKTPGIGPSLSKPAILYKSKKRHAHTSLLSLFEAVSPSQLAASNPLLAVHTSLPD
jgi:hypothetical protein